MKVNKNETKHEAGRVVLILSVTIAIASIALLGIKAFADVACYGFQYPDGSPLHASSASTVVCNSDCTGTGYCYDYTYDPDGTIPKTCSTGIPETGTACHHDTTDVTKSGKEGDPTCVLKPNSTTECQLGGQCLNWRSITNTIMHVDQDYTDSYGCRTPPAG
jgi:hypothetical protein